MFIVVPSTNGVGAHGDPRHKSYWNKLSFYCYAHPEISLEISEYVGLFQLANSTEYYPSPWHEQMNFPVVQAQMFKLGAEYEPMGPMF